VWIDKLPRLAEKAFTQFWVLLIITPALAISTWSLATLAIDKGHLPIALAVCISAIFDGAALGSYHIALQWQREHHSFGLSAQFAAVLFAASSCYLNWSHGKLLGLPTSLCYLLAAPSVVTLLMLEIYLRLKHRGNIRKRPVPRPELAAFILFPMRSFKLLRSIVGHRMNELEGTAIPAYNVLNDTPMPVIRAWLQDNGFQPGYSGRISRELLETYAKAMTAKSNGNGHGKINGKDLKQLTNTPDELNLTERY
jgi:Protein of unknown function (DUF2637)